jgi:hypothetical protein
MHACDQHVSVMSGTAVCVYQVVRSTSECKLRATAMPTSVYESSTAVATTGANSLTCLRFALNRSLYCGVHACEHYCSDVSKHSYCCVHQQQLDSKCTILTVCTIGIYAGA